ncbi:amidohydrolase [Pseudomarimonas arenosa]|uniref:Amidohydrolase n=1 Tax=Pseudomarimonas arenosa TaxID=2774145 RepID=A0AAW3ZQ23_9GAMM|nr:amidohydrolase [Pseudomarimonas arenosa]MBD8526702.1 amidohydrolase [Pseudomarimonas arenosa]
MLNPPLRLKTLLAATVLAAIGGSAQADTLVLNAHIITIDDEMPLAEAMLFDAGGVIRAIGSRAELETRAAQARRLDLGGATVVPGLIDAHGHVLNQGLALMRVDLVGTESKAAVIQRLQAFARDLPADSWLLGRGWDQNDWPGADGEFPSAADLDTAFPDRPVWLTRIDGHAGWANSAAMRLATRDLDGKWQPEGGQVLRQNARATGVFIDTAMSVIAQAIPKESEQVLREALRRSTQHLVQLGLTGVHDAGVSWAQFQLMQGLADRGELALRIYAMADGDSAALERLCQSGPYRHANGRLSMRAVKLYSDGALGSRGALLNAPYSDAPDVTGLPVMSRDALAAAMKKAAECGVQAATHAIGDAANQRVLDLYQDVLHSGHNKAGGDHRWRIEHAQIIAPSDLGRFSKLGVIASMQPTHATSDMPWAEQRVGPSRIVGGYAWRSLRDLGVHLALGSDFPVESADPMLGLFAAITRQDLQGQPLQGWYPAQRLTAYEALRGFTLDAAYAGFDEQRLGSLRIGKQADFVVLRRDPLALNGQGLLERPVQATYVDGQPVYQRAGND